MHQEVLFFLPERRLDIQDLREEKNRENYRARLPGGCIFTHHYTDPLKKGTTLQSLPEFRDELSAVIS